MAIQPKRHKTLAQRPSVESMIKPGELIDFVEMSPLSLVDRRTYNLLLAHAWDRIDQALTHVLAKSELRGLHESNDRIGDSIERLMAAIVRTYVEVDGKPAIQRTQLLGSTTEARAPDGLLYYSFSAEMRAIIRDSRIFARLHKDVILQLSSRYSLALYELCRKRVNLEHTWSEEFTVERFRQLLGVEPGKLAKFKHFNERAIQPAVAEVNLLCDFGCRVEPVLAGRKTVKVNLSWWRKNTDELKAAYRELQAAKVGRKARLKGTVEQTVPQPPMVTDAALETSLAKIESAVVKTPDFVAEKLHQQVKEALDEQRPDQPIRFMILSVGDERLIERLRRLLKEDGIDSSLEPFPSKPR
jgi:Initiator Rep protein, WH2/Initiator Replication protein, WH1